jgi:hypothetical protein
LDSLQFQKAEFADNAPRCTACKLGFGSEFFQLAGQNICPACADLVRKNQEHPSNSAVARGLLYGAGAALVCFIGYAAIIMITGMSLALVAILVGYLVGSAVRKGSRGLSGRRCQIAAVALTYLAITFSYIPAGIREAMKQDTAAKTEARQSKAGEPPKEGSLFVAILALSGVAIVFPFLALGDGFSGILGLLIIGLGLQRAWRLTARDERLLTGPFQREEAPAVG